MRIVRQQLLGVLEQAAAVVSEARIIVAVGDEYGGLPYLLYCPHMNAGDELHASREHLRSNILDLGFNCLCQPPHLPHCQKLQ